MRLVRQPNGSKLCTHCCIAMVLGITLPQAIKRLGHERATRNHELVRALGAASLSAKGVLFKILTPTPDPCIVRVRWGKTLRHHSVLYYNGLVYDPEAEAPMPGREFLEFVAGFDGRIVRCFPVKVRHG